MAFLQKLGRIFSWKNRPTTHQRVELLAKLLESKYNGEMNILEEHEVQGGISIPAAEASLKGAAIERGCELFDRKLEGVRLGRGVRQKLDALVRCRSIFPRENAS